MRISYSLGSLLTIDQIFKCSKILAKTNTDIIWVPETWGMENFSMLSAISQITTTKIGSSIINIYSRSPATIAMGAATVDTISKGNLILGLGTSSLPIVEEFHGYEFKTPLRRMREYVEIIRMAYGGEKISYNGKIFNLKNFTLLIKPPRKKIPIYIAAVNQQMVNLAWDIADGTIFYLRPKQEMKKTIQTMQKMRKIEVACQLITCTSKDSEKAISRAKQTLAFYISVGKIYREFLAKNGFKTETTNIYDEYTKSGFKTNHELITKRMLDELTICGTSEECKKQLSEFRDTGIDLPIIQFNPVGDVMDSFRDTVQTFSIKNE
ncbi:MAG: LLM class flavin-dependent oxidoreductase [Nitrosarchaeum sp.]|nr:LLM class flavin-dependent oxidoreductase [Nitrosarchaeum sp.]MCA9820621.1 LLM class flavin-dependent oxidoreductase [Nitrosarchaeum sp.]